VRSRTHIDGLIAFVVLVALLAFALGFAIGHLT
jgi:hypothetical protein